MNRREMRHKLRNGPASLMEVMKKPREPEEAKDSSDEELFLRSDVRPGMLPPPPHTLSPFCCLLFFVRWRMTYVRFQGGKSRPSHHLPSERRWQ